MEKVTSPLSIFYFFNFLNGNIFDIDLPSDSFAISEIENDVSRSFTEKKLPVPGHAVKGVHYLHSAAHLLQDLDDFVPEVEKAIITSKITRLACYCAFERENSSDYALPQMNILETLLSDNESNLDLITELISLSQLLKDKTRSKKYSDMLMHANGIDIKEIGVADDLGKAHLVSSISSFESTESTASVKNPMVPTPDALYSLMESHIRSLGLRVEEVSSKDSSDIFGMNLLRNIKMSCKGVCEAVSTLPSFSTPQSCYHSIVSLFMSAIVSISSGSSSLSLEQSLSTCSCVYATIMCCLTMLKGHEADCGIGAGADSGAGADCGESHDIIDALTILSCSILFYYINANISMITGTSQTPISQVAMATRISERICGMAKGGIREILQARKRGRKRREQQLALEKQEKQEKKKEEEGKEEDVSDVEKCSSTPLTISSIPSRLFSLFSLLSPLPLPSFTHVMFRLADMHTALSETETACVCFYSCGDVVRCSEMLILMNRREDAMVLMCDELEELSEIVRKERERLKVLQIEHELSVSSSSIVITDDSTDDVAKRSSIFRDIEKKEKIEQKRVNTLLKKITKEWEEWRERMHGMISVVVKKEKRDGKHPLIKTDEQLAS
ncbi:hypothetical protein ADUPG1_008592, partial [Aduncisulcus paluster]